MLDNVNDFDRLMELAKSNPKALEELRQKEVESIINNAPESMQRRLRGLQFQIDCKRRTHTSAMAACISISKMMHDSLLSLNAALHGRPEPTEPEEKGKILSFTKAG